MAQRQIPNLPPAVSVSATAQLEIVQDGVTYRASAGQISNIGSFRININNDTTSSNPYYPLFAKSTDAQTDTIWTSDPNYNYVPYEGRLSARRVESTQGIVYNGSVATLEYTFPSDDNATSCGPLTLTAAITVPNNSEWIIL